MLGSIHPAIGQKKSKLKLLGADKMIYDEAVYGKVRILKGNVRFKQNATLMYCDSAALFASTNSMKAFGNVKIIDSKKKTEMRGDSLIYNGNTKKGKLRGNITFISENQVLKTRHLDFNTQKDLAHYFGGGIITNTEDHSELESKVGYYYSNTKSFFFKDSVKYITQEYEIYSDTMEYDGQEDIVYFHGPTRIYGDSSSILCSSGWYNKKSKISTFSKDVIIESDGQVLRSDSVIYHQALKTGEAFGSVEILDTANKTQVNGDYAEYDNIKKKSLVTGHIELVLIFTKDSLYLHSDTMYTSYDATNTHRIIHAYNHVQFYKSDLQGKCDSLTFSEIDSTIRMFITPVVWIDSNQVTGKEIVIKTYDGVIQNMQIFEDAFMVSEEDSALFNQVKGKSLYAHFKNNEIYKIDVNRSGQTIYYVRDEHQELMGMNRLDCSNMSIFVDSLGINSIKFFKKPDGTFYPMNDVKDEMKILRHFYWRIDERPFNRKAIFNWVEIPDRVSKTRKKK
jgi:lipopolysaccharide export system protein LptA